MKETSFLKEMGNRIYLRRKALRLTQEELAERINVSTQMISNLETGKKAIRPENLSKLSAALNISCDYILTGREHCVPTDPLYLKFTEMTPKERRLLTELIEYMREK